MLYKVFEWIRKEYNQAQKKHPRPMVDGHHAYGITKEELDEFWAEVKADGSDDRKRAELIQVATMACRAVIELFMPPPWSGKEEPPEGWYEGLNAEDLAGIRSRAEIVLVPDEDGIPPSSNNLLIIRDDINLLLNEVDRLNLKVADLEARK